MLRRNFTAFSFIEEDLLLIVLYIVEIGNFMLFSTHLTMLEHIIAEGHSVCPSVCLTDCLSVCHTGDPCLNGSRYGNMFHAV